MGVPVCVAVLASGSGTILEAILEAGVPVALVVADRPCRALAVAAEAGVAAELVRRDSFGPEFDRLAYTHRVLDRLLAHPEARLVAMAGFGTVLDKPLVQAYEGRVLNTHPALLPAFPGWHAVEAALDAGVKVTGCTVHIAVAEVDAGPILAQEAVAILPGDTVSTLHERIKAVERRLYPAAIQAVLAAM
ncbi:MAG: phosphoribosylglycinamide formyltransferase [Acidimicrobiales bacterium]